MGGVDHLQPEPIESGWFVCPMPTTEGEIVEQPFMIDDCMMQALMMQTAIAVFVDRNTRDCKPHVQAAIYALRAGNTAEMMHHVEGLTREVEAGFARENPDVIDDRDDGSRAIFRAGSLMYVARCEALSAEAVRDAMFPQPPI